MKEAMVKIVLSLTLIPVSILGMMWGWGLEPASWGWVALSYGWVILVGMLME